MKVSTRDHRIDFLRGLALVSIFINHVPGNVWEHVTHKNFGFSDAAEVFVLLAGYASAFAYFAVYERGEKCEAVKRAWRRAGVLYMSHIVVSLAAIATFCAAALWLAEPAYLEDSLIFLNLKPFFSNPVSGVLGLVTLGHQLGYFNILSMYMVILLMLPAMLWLATHSLRLLIWLSAALWLAAGVFSINMPNYPLPGGWFFNPFAWQLLFALGLFLGIRSRRGQPLSIPRPVQVLAALYCLGAALWVHFELWAWQPALPPDWWWAHHFYYFDKTYLSIPRLLHVLALAAVVMMPPWGDWLRRIPPSNVLAGMGRHSLPVFCCGSLLAMTGAVLRTELGGSLAMDSLIVGSGLALLAGLALVLDGGRYRRPKISASVPETLARWPLHSPQ